MRKYRILSFFFAAVLVISVTLGVSFSMESVFPSDEEDLLEDLGDYTIAVDPGHGGNDPGAIGPSGYTEAECALDIGLRLRDLLEANGAEVVMTRETDVTVSLSERTNIANNAGADIFVSIHNNAFDGTVQGIETFYWEGLPPDSEAAQLSDLLQTELINEIDSPDRGVKTANFHVLRETSMPASLTENLFIDNPEEEAKLMDPSVRQRIADAHHRAICEYFDVDPGPPEDAEFVLSGWSVSSSTVEPGETVTVQGQVQNVGSGAGTVSVDMTIDGDFEASTDPNPTLDPGQSEEVTFHVSRNEEDTYDVAVHAFEMPLDPPACDSWFSEFTVEQDTGAPAPPKNLAVEHYGGDNPDGVGPISFADSEGEYSEINMENIMGSYSGIQNDNCCDGDPNCWFRFDHDENEDISPDPVEVGETVTISGEVQHFNGQEWSQAAVSLWIDGTEVDAHITNELGSFTTESFSFQRTKDTPGTYDVDLYVFYWDGGAVGGWHQRWSSSFEVVDAGEPQFELSGWSVDPNTVEPNEDVTIEGYVENTGDTTEDDIFARYFIDGSLVDAVPVGDGFAPGDDAFISRDFSREETGIYDVEIVAYCDATATDHNTWESEFEVVEEGEPQFELSGWSISPSTVEPGETVTIQGDITNVGDETGDVSAELYIDGDHEATNWGTLAPGETDTFTHHHSESDVGHYHVEVFAWCDEKEGVDDQWNGDFEVVEEVAVEVETIGASGITQDSATLEGEVVDMGGIDAPHNRLSWDASPDDGDVDHYNIYRSEDQGGPWDTPIASVNADGSTSYQHIDENSAGEPRYWYVVRAEGTNGIEEGNTDSVQEPTADTVVEVFFRYRESGASTWSETETEQVASEGPFEHTVSGLEPDTQYEFKAVVQWDGDEDTGEVMTFLTDDDTDAPAPPEDLEVEHHGTYDRTSSTAHEQITVSEPDLLYTLFEDDFQSAYGSRDDSPFYKLRSTDWGYYDGYWDGYVEGVTVHHTGGSFAPRDGDTAAHSSHEWHRDNNGWPGIAYHFVIGKDGDIYHGSPVDSIGFHAGDERNRIDIGIKFDGGFNPNSAVHEPTDAQYEAGGHLIAYLEYADSIMDDRSGSVDLGIDGFEDVTPHTGWGVEGCPGLYFDRDTLEYYYEQYSNGEDPNFELSGWSVNPNTVNPGDTVTVEGHVENIGGGGGYVSVDIFIDDDFEASTSPNPYLGPDESEWVSFDISREDVGLYDVDVHAFEMVGGEPVFPAHDSWSSEFEVVDDDDLPEFILNDWSVSPETANPEETVTIEGEIENVGSVEDVVYGQLWIDDEWQDSEYTGSLAPGETSWVSFQHSEESVGTYDVEIRAVCEDSDTVYDTWDSGFEVVGDVEVETVGATDVTTDSAVLHGDLVDIGDEGTEHNLLTWTASPDDPDDVSHYNIYRSENQDGPWDEPLDSVDADGLVEYSYVDPYAGLADDTFWWYVVRAVGTNEVEEGNTDAVQEPEEDADVHVFFRYRELGHSEWMETEPKPMITEGTFYEEISALDSGKEYEFKAVAQWDGQEGLGQIETFETVVEEYTLEIGVEGEGTTDPEPGTYMYDEGTEVTIEATPDEGWEFSHWSGDEGMDLLDAGGPVTYGFWPYWTDPADYEPDWDKLTHISVFSMTAQPDGSLCDGNMSHYYDVKAAAEGTDTKVTLTVAQFNTSYQNDFLKDAQTRQDLVDNIVGAIDDYGADGVNIDFEGVEDENVENIEDFFERLYNDVRELDEDLHISFCTMGWVEIVYRNSQLSEYTDHVFLMGYDYHWGGADYTGPVSPFDSSQYFDVTDSMDILRDYYPDEQLLLGLPFYGYEWPAERR